MKWLYFGVKISYLLKIKRIFCNLTGKFLKYIVFVYLVINLRAYFSTYIHLVVYTYKTNQNIFVCLPQNLTF